MRYCIGAVLAVGTVATALASPAGATQKTHREQASGTITVTGYNSEPVGVTSKATKVNRVLISEAFAGDIAGRGTASFTQVVNADKTAVFWGAEQIQATLDGKSGSFVLESSGTIAKDRSAVGKWEIVPGSGSGGLAGLRGNGTFHAAVGQHATYVFKYSIGG